MEKGSSIKPSTVWSLAVVLMLCAGPATEVAKAAEQAGRAAEPGLDMVGVLRADSPHPSLGGHAGVIGRLVGSWDVDYMDVKKDGTTLHRTGQLHFGWVVDGLILQDVWIVDPWGSHKEREVYTDLFYYDPKSSTWREASVDPYTASVATFTGGAVGADRIALESQDLVPNETRRWSFDDIRSDSLVFRDEASRDGGKTWRLTGEYHMKRRDASPTARQPSPARASSN